MRSRIALNPTLLVTVMVWGLFAGYLGAAVVLDGSVGTPGPLAGPDYVVSQTRGRLVGSNLFHSFSTFDISANESVTFTSFSNANIANVIARVTGGAPSNVNGVLRNAVPNSNLYLINSAGVIFGPSAVLDVPGNFTASTASYARFSDGGRFFAGLGQDGNLSSAQPAAFGFLAANPAPITFNGSASQTLGISVPSGHSISLIGGGIQIVGGKLLAVGGNINLVSAASTGEVMLPAGDSSTAAAPDVSELAALGIVNLLDGASLTAPVGGRVVIRSGSLNVASSVIDTDTDVVNGGGVDVAVSGPLQINHGRISAETSGASRGGDIHLTADSITVNGLSSDGLSAISTNTSSTGTAGDIAIHTGSFSATANAGITAFTQTSGNGGNISLTASRDIHIDGTGAGFLTGLAVESFPSSTGRAGSIAIDTPLLTMLNTAEITSTTKGSGNAGSITINAGKLNMDGGNLAKSTLIQARVGKGEDDAGATGHGGQILIHADAINLREGGVVTATNFGRGTGGDIVVHAKQITAIGSPDAPFTGFFARTVPDQPFEGGGGPGGSVRIYANTMRLQGNAAVSAVSTSGGGRAGSVLIGVQSLTLQSGAAVTVQADPGIEGGDITVKASRDIELYRSKMSAQADGDGRIFLTALDHLLLRSSQITAQGTGKGGGQITIDPPSVILDKSLINGLSAGIPVQVDIAQDASFITSESRILSSAISIPPEIDIAGSLIHLPSATLAGTAKLEPQCGVRFLNQDVSSFLVAGRGGEPPQPGAWLPELSLQPPSAPAEKR